MRRALLLTATLGLAGCGSSTPASTPAPSATPAPVATPTPAPAPPPVVRGPQFDQSFWNQFVHNGFEQPGALQPLRRLTAAPRLYLKTVDEAGNVIDFATLNTVQTAMREVAATWGGGVFGLAGIEQGTGTRDGQAGWLTVKWPNPSAGALCGRAQIGTDGGWIELNYLRADATCGCGASRMRTGTAKHELGHSFGYYHTDTDTDVMRNGVNGCVESSRSARETYHATVAYQTPVGSTDFRDGLPVIIVD